MSRLIEKYLKELFEERELSEETRAALWEYYYNTLSQGIDLGYYEGLQYYDADLAQALKNDIAKFSAFKETSFKNALESALTQDGAVVPWSEFKKVAKEINLEYNMRWLKTEYHHTVATANSVEQWQGFVADADLYPNLQYNAVNDERTREKHRQLDGLILPVNHVFWKTHTTPLDWGCRCNITQTDAEASKVIPTMEVKNVFKNNAAMTGKVFGDIPYATGMTKNEVKDTEQRLKDRQKKTD